MNLDLKFRYWVVGIILLMSSTGTSAENSKAANREWVRVAVQDQVNQGKLDAAISILRDHLQKDGEDSESWARLAMLQTRTLKCEEAQLSLNRASQVGPTSMRNAFRAAADQMKTQGCKGQLSQDLASGSSGEAQSLSAETTVSAKLRFGNDSNVILLSDSATNSSSPSSNFVNPALQADWKKTYATGMLEARSLSSYTAYTSADVDTYNSFYQSIAAEWEPTPDASLTWSKKFGDRFDVSFVNSDGMKFFSWVNTAYAQFSRALANDARMGFELPLGYQKYSSETAATSEERRDGLIVSPSVWYARRFEMLIWNASAAYSQSLAEGKNFRSRAPSVATGVSGTLHKNWRARSNISYTQVDYFDSSTGRKDKRLDAGLGVVYNWPSRSSLSLGLDIFATDNRSNLDGATYKRNTVMGQVDYAF